MSSEKNLALSVVIPTYNRLDTLQAVLNAFNHQTLNPEEFEVILVDSLSNDGTEAFVEKFKTSSKFQFRYIRQKNRGRSGARNRGIVEAKGDVVVFIDSDIIPESGFLEAHFKFHLNHERSVAVGWESRINSVSELSEAQRQSENRFKIHPPTRKMLSWLYFLTGNASAPRESLVRVGLFDEAFQGYGFEDLELGYRLSKAGLKIYYLPQAVNYHVHPRTLETQYEVQRLAGRNAVLFYKKHKDWRIKWRLGMSPLAFLWHRFLKSWPPIYRLLENKAKSAPQSSFASQVLIQHHYLLGVEEAWK